jgi:hypothetical protein
MICFNLNRLFGNFGCRCFGRVKLVLSSWIVMIASSSGELCSWGFRLEGIKDNI